MSGFINTFSFPYSDEFIGDLGYWEKSVERARLLDFGSLTFWSEFFLRKSKAPALTEAAQQKWHQIYLLAHTELAARTLANS